MLKPAAEIAERMNYRQTNSLSGTAYSCRPINLGGENRSGPDLLRQGSQTSELLRAEEESEKWEEQS